ncbi:hypothetical protein GOODEAATRI_027261, partial [Goodea atripinnis]
PSTTDNPPYVALCLTCSSHHLQNFQHKHLSSHAMSVGGKNINITNPSNYKGLSFHCSVQI